MSRLLLIFVGFTSLSSLANAREGIPFPLALSCQNFGDCVAGLPDFCAGEDYFPQLIERPAEHAVEAYDPSALLSENELAGKVMIDLTDGDQYSFYFFDVSDMSALAEGKVGVIQGTYEDGYDWVNGYNTRAKFKVECKAGL